MSYVVPERKRPSRPRRSDLLPDAARPRPIGELIRETLELLELERRGSALSSDPDDDEGPTRLGARQHRQ